MSASMRRLVPAGVAVVALGIVAVVAIVLAGGDGTVERVAPDEPGRLLAEGRTHLSLCVDGAGGGGVGSREVELVSIALDAALAGLDEVPAEFGEPAVASGCPELMPFTGERIDYDDLCCRFAKKVNEANEHLLNPNRVFVYFVPDDMFTKSFGDEPFILGGAEYVCSGDACGEATVALYVSDAVGNAVLADGVLHSLSLDEPEPEPTTDWSVCVRGTPESWCVHYDFCVVPTPTSPEYCEEFWERTGLEPPQ